MFDTETDPTKDVAHRPWPLPDGPWIMAQRWNDLLFAHWPVSVDVIRPLVPSELTLDRYGGTAWLSVTPFLLDNLHARGLPALPWGSEFFELNVRTYVTVGGKGGVFFFSLDASSALAVAGARTLFNLPYFQADMRATTRPDGTIDYESKRKDTSSGIAVFSGSFAPAGEVLLSKPGSLEHWLTERYCLYTVSVDGTVHRTEIHHRQWPLQPARAEIRVNTMASAAGVVLPDVAPRLSFCKSLDVVIWAPHAVGS